MPLLLLAIVATPLFLSLGWTASRFREVERLETFLIELDNAAIVLGRNARSVWNGLQAANEQIAFVDNAHHIAHACARSGAATPQCVAVDKALEVRLKTMHLRAAAVAQEVWRQGPRSSLVPIRSQTCSLCGTAFWEIGARRSESVERALGLRKFKHTVHWLGRSLRGGRKWDYSIEAEEHDGD